MLIVGGDYLGGERIKDVGERLVAWRLKEKLKNKFMGQLGHETTYSGDIQ